MPAPKRHPGSPVVRIEALVRKLSFPRYVGTANEARARQIIKEECTALGLGYEPDPFKTSDFFMKYINTVPYFIVGLYVLVFTVLAIVVAGPALVLVLGAALLVLSFSIEAILHAVKYPAMYCRFARVVDTENIVIEKKAAGSGLPSHSIFFLAHSDSKTEKPDPQRWFVLEYLAISFGSWALAAHAIVYGVLGLLAGGVIPHAPGWFFYGIAIAVVDMLRISTAYYEGDSPGASDDAIGVAIVLELMNRLSSESFQHVNVTGVITGAEEVGEAGAYQFIMKRAGKLDKRACHFIAIDGMCKSRVRYFTSFGYTFKKFSPLVRRALENLVAKGDDSTTGISFSRSWMPPPVNTDHSAVFKLGYEAFLLESNVGVTHTAKDTPDVIDYGFAARFVEFLASLVKEIDALAGKGAPSRPPPKQDMST
ncbi:MAG: M28 family peptidase [Candidatus Lokiarchaeota archaeon]|nr:M28 family peptidase [Candidatus Lokiarchaeota archaeon]